jgi:hypothetical protein
VGATGEEGEEDGDGDGDDEGEDEPNVLVLGEGSEGDD